MKIQKCTFKRTKGGKWEMGIAWLTPTSSFGMSSVDFFVDMKGERQGDIYDYNLIDTPLSHIDMDYGG